MWLPKIFGTLTSAWTTQMFADPKFWEALRNNFLWLLMVPGLSTAFGLLAAVGSVILACDLWILFEGLRLLFGDAAPEAETRAA